MIRKSFVFAVAAALLLCLLCGSAAAEDDPVPATPTDLECAHPVTKTIIYFYDSPLYTSVSSASHRVSGPATVQTVCAECGEVLESWQENNAEEIRPHRMKKGVCALCGYREKTLAAVTSAVNDLPGERTFYAQQEEGTQGLMSLTLSNVDLVALENAHITTVIVRGERGIAAIALEVAEIRVQTELNHADLYLELEEQEDGSFFAGVCLITDPGEKKEAGEEGITLRFYQEQKEDVRVSMAPVDGEQMVEAASSWNENGFWTVQYVREGTYFLLQ